MGLVDSSLKAMDVISVFGLYAKFIVEEIYRWKVLGSVQKSVYIRDFLVCTNVINNGVMVMYRPPAYYSGKVPDEKLIFNKEWPNVIHASLKFSCNLRVTKSIAER